MTAIKTLFLIFFGFASGMVIAGAVFAFIAIIGVVPRMAQKTGTQRYIMLYEEAIILGGILGTLTLLFDFYLPIGRLLVMLVSLCIGVFYGCLAMSLAEVLRVVPILTRRVRLQRGMFFFIMALALGKLSGSLLYHVIPGFFKE